MRRTDIYLETSALNSLAAMSNPNDAIATGILHRGRRNRLYVSPVTLWEVLLTADEGHKEGLIQFAQSALHHEMLASPSELVVRYIEKGCPVMEPRQDVHSRLSLAQVWNDICADRRRTFVYDRSQLASRTKVVRDMFRQLARIAGGNGPLVCEHPGMSELLPSLDSLIGCPTDNRSRKCNRRQWRELRRYTALLMLFFMCCETDIDPTPIMQFWASRGIHDIKGRADYLFTEHRNLLSRGPFVEMAIVALAQLNQRADRGLYLDCLHGLYLSYVDVFLTNDEHYRRLARVLPHPLFSKVLLLRDAQIVRCRIRIDR